MITRRALLGGTAVFAANPRAFSQPVAQEHCGRQTEPGADKIFYDGNGLIAQQDCDGGDTAQREGWYWLGRTVRTVNNLGPAWPERDLSFEKVMTKLEIGQTGTFRRNPDRWNDPADFTRDQTVPIVAAMGIRNDKITTATLLSGVPPP